MSDTIEKFDKLTGSISILDIKLAVGRSRFALAKVGKNAYIIGGNTDGRFPTETVEILDMEQETITEGRNVPVADFGFTACVL